MSTFIAFRLPDEYADILKQYPNMSSQIRQFVISGLKQADYPRKEEQEQLQLIRNDLRRIGINLNQFVRKLNSGDQLKPYQVRTLYSELCGIRTRISKILEAYGE